MRIHSRSVPPTPPKTFAGASTEGLHIMGKKDEGMHVSNILFLSGSLTAWHPPLRVSFRIAGSPLTDPGTRGHEYARHLSAELGDEYTFHEQDEEPTPAPEGGA
ncbi:hypothetical protein B0H11DRAFT_1924517 [Mycena galericulata]|nr:hypothetical protein B0H11DRAFT_1924517 [Mycena galericulata]